MIKPNTNLIILQSGPATGKTLLPYLLFNGFFKASGESTIVLDEDDMFSCFLKNIRRLPSGPVIIDAPPLSEPEELIAILDHIKLLHQRKDWVYHLFIISTQRQLPDEFYDHGYCWELKPILS